MKQANKLLLLVFLVVLIVLVGCSTEQQITTSESQGNKLLTKSSQGTVSIDLTPHKVSNGNLVVDIAVNTHSGDLSEFDLLQLVTLEFDGTTIKPKSAPQLQGHHSSGELVFDVKEDISNFKIIIKDIPDIEERVFEWL